MRKGGGRDEAVFYWHGEAGGFEAGVKARPDGGSRAVKIEDLNLLDALLKSTPKAVPAWGVRKQKDAVFDLSENNRADREVWFVQVQPVADLWRGLLETL